VADGPVEVAAGQHENELVSTVACGETSRLTRRSVDEARDLTQDAAADDMAVPIVHLLEVVEVHEQQADVASTPARCRNGGDQSLLQGSVVEQAGQAVAARVGDLTAVNDLTERLRGSAREVSGGRLPGPRAGAVVVRA